MPNRAARGIPALLAFGFLLLAAAHRVSAQVGDAGPAGVAAKLVASGSERHADYEAAERLFDDAMINFQENIGVVARFIAVIERGRKTRIDRLIDLSSARIRCADDRGLAKFLAVHALEIEAYGADVPDGLRPFFGDAAAELKHAWNRETVSEKLLSRLYERSIRILKFYIDDEIAYIPPYEKADLSCFSGADRDLYASRDLSVLQAGGLTVENIVEFNATSRYLISGREPAAALCLAYLYLRSHIRPRYNASVDPVAMMIARKTADSADAALFYHSILKSVKADPKFYIAKTAGSSLLRAFGSAKIGGRYYFFDERNLDASDEFVEGLRLFIKGPCRDVSIRPWRARSLIDLKNELEERGASDFTPIDRAASLAP